MWVTSDNELIPTLPPAHAFLYRTAAGFLSSTLGWNPNAAQDPIGVAAYDRLTVGQKQLTILEVSRALLDPNVEPPDVTGASCAVIDHIYHVLRYLVEVEIEDERTELREKLLEAMQEEKYWEESQDIPEEERDKLDIPPKVTDSDSDRWGDFIEALVETVLEDFDYSLEDEFMDMPPAASEQLKNQMNIDSDYFVHTPDDPAPEQFHAMRKEIRELLW